MIETIDVARAVALSVPVTALIAGLVLGLWALVSWVRRRGEVRRSESYVAELAGRRPARHRRSS